MSNDRRLRMPPAAAYWKEKLRYRAERLRREVARTMHGLWLRGVRRVGRCLERRRSR